MLYFLGEEKSSNPLVIRVQMLIFSQEKSSGIRTRFFLFESFSIMHRLVVFYFLVILARVEAKSSSNTILFIPLDERFTTRSIVINLARLIGNDFTLLTPRPELISHWKQPANTTVLFTWLENQISSSCSMSSSCSLLLSTEQLLYGGLINSRISNTSYDDLDTALQKLVEIKRAYGSKLKIYLTSVIMRIPAYNGDFEEPDYWAMYGRLLYLWSFYTDRFNVLHNPDDEKAADTIEKEIPVDVLDQFVWRRSRNYNLTYTLLHDYTATYFERIWLTLDDNAEYGFNKAEERKLLKLISDPSLNISSKVNIYPGADEVSLAVLSQIVVNNRVEQEKPTFMVRYRNITTKDYIPNYEGAPLNESILKQITAVGGQYVDESNGTSPDILVLVNNWSTETQPEAGEPQTCEDYSPLNIPANRSIIVYADVRYSNGGDICFSEWVRNRTAFGEYTYAGWNTNGNTLGTCLSNGVLLNYYLNDSLTQKENRRFTMYRFVEDVHYQADLRQYLSSYLTHVSLDPSDQLNNDLPFYETFIQKGFRAYSAMLTNEFNVTNVYFPWNRTFEIGFEMIDHQF